MSRTNLSDTNAVIHFESGILGFEEYKDYVLMSEDDNDFMMILQSVENKDISFVVVDPYVVLDKYEPVIGEQDIKYFGDKTDLKYLMVTVIPADVSKTAVNLKSPIVIDCNSMKARQVILDNRNYPVRYFLFEK